MNFAKKTLFFALLLTLASLAASAQERVVTFTLNQDAYFGTALLSPGSYSLKLLSETTPKAIVVSLGAKPKAAIVAVTARDYSSCATTTITLTPTNDRLSMSSICFANSEMAYRFPVSTRPAQLRQVAKREVAHTQALADAR